MKKMSDKNFYLLFISLFIVLNLLNGYVVSLPFFKTLPVLVVIIQESPIAIKLRLAFVEFLCVIPYSKT